MNDKTWSIYILIDPRTDEVRYVGWAYDTNRRLRDHIKASAYEQTHKANWIKQLCANGIRPICEVVETGNDSWADAERRWIAYYREQGARLTNLTDGGDGMPGYSWTDEQRERLRQRIFTDTHRERIAAAKTGRPLSDEHRKTLSEVKRGIPISDEHRQKLIAAHTGKPLSEDHRRKLSEIHKGRAFSDETRQRMSQAQRGRKIGPMSEEHKRKIADAHRGKPGTPWTEEHRRKVVETKQRRREGND